MAAVLGVNNLAVAEAPVTTVATTSAPTSAPATKPATAPSTTTIANIGSLKMAFDAPGYFEPVESTEVRFRFKAYAGELTVDNIVANGASVKKGDRILVIDPTNLVKQLDAAENELTVSTANLEKALADAKLSEEADGMALKSSQNGLKDAEEALKFWEKVDGPHMLKSWDLQVKQWTDNVDDRADELDQLKKMYKSEELTSATADIVVRRSIRALDQAKINSEMMKEQIAKYKETAYPNSKRGVTDAVDRARNSLASVQVAQKAGKISRSAGLVTAKAANAAVSQKVADLKEDLEKLTVIAPADGIVWYGQLNMGNWVGGDAKAMKVGEKVTAGTVLLTHHIAGKLQGVVELSETKYFTVPDGAKARLSVSAFPNMHLDGVCKVVARTPIAGQGGQIYPMKIVIDNVDAKILPGMKSSVKIEVPPLDKVLLIPTSAVVDSAVYVHEKNGTDVRKPVVTGYGDGKQVQIVSGINEGDEVLTQGKP